MSKSDGHVLELSGIHLRRGETTILRDVSWRVKRGEHWAILGANGSGKTSLLKVATGGMWATAGEVRSLGCLHGTIDLREHRKRIGWVSNALENWIPAYETARKIVVSGLYASFGLFNTPSEDELTRAGDILAFLGCSAVAERPYGLLSQGEKQKTLIGRAMIAGPEILILDEAAAGLDPTAREVLSETVERLAGNPQGPTVILVTHHIEEIVPSITHVLVMAEGCILASGKKADILTADTLKSAFKIPIEIDHRHGRYWVRVTESP